MPPWLGAAMPVPTGNWRRYKGDFGDLLWQDTILPITVMILMELLSIKERVIHYKI